MYRLTVKAVASAKKCTLYCREEFKDALQSACEAKIKAGNAVVEVCGFAYISDLSLNKVRRGKLQRL